MGVADTNHKGGGAFEGRGRGKTGMEQRIASCLGGPCKLPKAVGKKGTCAISFPR